MYCILNIFNICDLFDHLFETEYCTQLTTTPLNSEDYVYILPPTYSMSNLFEHLYEKVL